MSGGSLDYVYSKISYAADEIDVWLLTASLDCEDKDIMEFMRKVETQARRLSEALHDAEWYMSYDYGPDSLRNRPSFKRIMTRRRKAKTDERI